jgi:hypothetical protein
MRSTLIQNKKNPGSTIRGSEKADSDYVRTVRQGIQCSLDQCST